tara:strand:- start:68 stop:709 length:642 start_codon:yes stop_codon:yes gene_type:complete
MSKTTHTSFLGDKLNHAVENNRLNTIQNYNVGIKVYPPHVELRMRSDIASYHRFKKDITLVKFDVTKVFFQYLDQHTNQREIQTLEKAFLSNSDGQGTAKLQKVMQFIEYDIFGDVLQNKHSFPTYLADKAHAEFKRASNKQVPCSLWLYGVGTLYPALRPSSLLRYIHSILQWEYQDKLSILLFYPGHYDNGLHFMSQLSSDNDYRPKIYEG